MQDSLAPPAVRYIKLGQGGKWFAHARAHNLLELGHTDISHEIALSGDRAAVRAAFIDAGHGAATAFAREVCEFMTLPVGSLWITFEHGSMWWAIAGGETYWLGEGKDHGMRARALSSPWRQTDLSGALLSLDTLSGALTKLAAYRQSICSVKAENYALRRINALPSPLLAPALKAREDTIAIVRAMIAELDPIDFEILVDLIFVHGGWRRVSAVGGSQADTDLVLQQPTTGERAFVQVKSIADSSVFADYLNRYRDSSGFSRMFFAVHTAKGNWPALDADVAVWRDDALAERAMDAGLFSWLLSRTR